MQSRRIIQVEEKVPLLQGIPLALQHLFAMFGASVLVPYLFNSAAGTQVVDPGLVLLMNGIGTFLYLFLCKGRAPAFLGSSFAYLSPAFAILASQGDKADNYARAIGGFAVSGLVFTLVALLIGAVGTKWINVVLPPATMGPIVALIGLELAATAASSAGLLPKTELQVVDGVATMVTLPLDPKVILVSLSTLAVVILGTVLFRGFLSVIPVLIAVVFGYVLSAALGMVSFDAVAAAPVLTVPAFTAPRFDLTAILIILPATLVVISEHIGHLFVTSKIVGRDLTKDPGLHRSMMGDGLSTMISGLIGSVPTTTYGENMGVMAITRVYSVWVIGGAAAISIFMAFFGNVSAFINSIPGAVMGGISLLLFGVIAASGIRMLVEAKVDYSRSRNLILTAITFIAGVSGVAISIGTVQLKGMSLATVVGMLLSLLFFVFDKLQLANDRDAEEEKVDGKAA